MISRFVFLTLFSYMSLPFFCNAQSITFKDGSDLVTAYCREDRDYAIAGQPGGGTFSGCGVFQQNGDWYFNPAAASENINSFPYQCMLTYTVNGTVTEVPVLVWKPVSLMLTGDTTTCNGDFSLNTETLYAGDYGYAWTPASALAQPGSAATAGHIQQTQVFTCTVTDLSTGCMGKSTISVTKYAQPQLSVTRDTSILQHASLQLLVSGAEHYTWSPAQWLNDAGIANPVTTPADSITYKVTGTNEFGCTASRQVHIDLARGVYFPSAFSPNGDGLNDEFRIVNFGYQFLKEFRIFNRWGQQVFFTMNGTQGWDGTYNNHPADAGTYHYLIRMKMDDGAENVVRGDLTLVR